MLQTLGIKDAQKLVPTSDDMEPRDPISENMAIMTSKPVKAFLYQDHKAHIEAHMTALQNPQIAQLIGQNPMARTIQAAAMAHIGEHVAMQYRVEIEKQMGADLPAPDAKMPEDMEVQLSQLMAKASAQVQQQSASEIAQQQAQDPLIQMQQQELAIKQAELQLKQMKLEQDAMIKQAEMQQKAQKDFVDSALRNEEIEAKKKIEGAKIGAQLATSEKELTAKQKIEGVKIGMEIAKDADGGVPGQ